MASIAKRIAQSQKDHAAHELALAQLEDTDRILLRDALDDFIATRTPVQVYANKKVRALGHLLGSAKYVEALLQKTKSTEERIQRAKELKATI